MRHFYVMGRLKYELPVGTKIKTLKFIGQFVN